MKRITSILLILVSHLHAIEYEKLAISQFATAHILTVNPQQNKIILTPARGNPQTVATLTRQRGAIAGINGGFWRDNGIPTGVLKVDDMWYGKSSKQRGAIGWSSKKNLVIFDQVKNRPKSTELITTETAPKSWEQMDYILGGAPLLIKNGRLIEDYTVEQASDTFLTQKRPRTAVGIKKNGDWVLLVVDGPLFDPRGGITIRELAQFMLKLGCIDALNLDGGGSSTMVYSGAVVNNPAGNLLENGKLVRAVSDAVLVLP